MLNLRNFCKSVAIGGFALLVLPLVPFPNPFSGLTFWAATGISSRLEAQRLRPRAEPPAAPAPAANPQAPAASSAANPATPPAPSAPPATPAASSAGLPPSLLDQPAKPAHIEFARNSLFIRADNSSLDEILRTLAGQSGMKIDGLGLDERVFGSFGPGNPKEVISDLLNGTPYNVLMAGTESDGAPSHLILKPSNDALAADAPAAPAPASAVPPSSPAQPAGVKSPQELFEELQAMRQQQQQQQHPPQ